MAATVVVKARRRQRGNVYEISAHLAGELIEGPYLIPARTAEGFRNQLCERLSEEHAAVTSEGAVQPWWC